MLRKKAVSTSLSAFSLALCGAVSAPGAAWALSQAVPSGTGFAKSVALSKFTSKSTKLGAFGAGWDSGLDLSVTSSSGVRASAAGGVRVQLFGQTTTAFGAGVVYDTDDGSCLTTSLTLLGQSIPVATPICAGEAEKTVSAHATFLHLQNTMMVGPAPVTLVLSAGGDAGFSARLTPELASPAIGATLVGTPFLNSSVTAQAILGTSGVGGGVEAELTLLDVSLPITLQPSFNLSTRVLDYYMQADIALNSLAGKIKLFVKAGLFKYSYKLLSWSGITKEWNLFATEHPSVGAPEILIGENAATGSYIFSDPNDFSESGSSLKWYRSATASGTGSLASSSSGSNGSAKHNLESGDNRHYLRLCVTPKNSAGVSGDQQCSDWRYVGGLITLYQDSGYDGDSVSIAYERTTTGSCFNLSAVGFDNRTSSYKLSAPADGEASIRIFNKANCSAAGEESSWPYLWGGTLAAGDSFSNGSLPNWRDNTFGSIQVLYGNSTSDPTIWAEDVDLTLGADGTLTASYLFVTADSVDEGDAADVSHIEESGSTYVIQRAVSDTGSGATTVFSGAASSGSLTRQLSGDDLHHYYRFCVTPRDPFTLGTEYCSAWRGLSPAVILFDGTGYGGSQLVSTYMSGASGACIDLGGFSNKPSSYKITGPSNMVVTFYKSAGCSGTAGTRGPSWSGDMDPIPGSDWNNAVSSMKVTW